MNKRKYLLLLLTSCILIGILPLQQSVAADEAEAPLEHSFESGTVNQGYDMEDWAAAGWHTPWLLGDDRSRIDSTYSHSGSKSLRITYPKGQFNPTDSGYMAPFRLEPADEYYVSFWARFDEDFSWGDQHYEGKLGIGLAGGGACSGGQTCTGDNGFSSRLIWRADGQAAIYYYAMDLPGPYGDKVFLTRPSGSSIYYPRGQWFNLVQRLKINTVTNGKANPDGEIEIWYNGEVAAKITGLRFVSNGDKVDKAYFATFYGGGTSEYAPTHDSYIWYDDMSVSSQRLDMCTLEPDGCAERQRVRALMALIPPHWAKADLRRAIEQQLWEGPEANRPFNPNAPIHRASLVELLARALRLELGDDQTPYPDTRSLDRGQRQAIAAALAAGITNGYADGSFRPQGEVTRAQLAAMLARGLRLPIAAIPPERLFADDQALPGWARDSIYALSSREILQGRSGHRFEPAAPVTFAEALVVLLRAVDLAEELR